VREQDVCSRPACGSTRRSQSPTRVPGRAPTHLERLHALAQPRQAPDFRQLHGGVEPPAIDPVPSLRWGADVGKCGRRPAKYRQAGKQAGRQHRDATFGYPVPRAEISTLPSSHSVSEAVAHCAKLQEQPTCPALGLPNHFTRQDDKMPCLQRHPPATALGPLTRSSHACHLLSSATFDSAAILPPSPSPQTPTHLHQITQSHNRARHPRFTHAHIAWYAWCSLSATATTPGGPLSMIPPMERARAALLAGGSPARRACRSSSAASERFHAAQA
jgi:hypothetical protein